MKYAASYHNAESCAAATTTYSEWFDVDWANELYCYVESVESVSGTYSIVVTVERCVPYDVTPTATTVLTFTTITGDTTEEKIARNYYDGTTAGAIGADNTIGMRVRFKYVNTWTSGTTVVHSRINAKRI